VSKGSLANTKQLMEAFGTSDTLEISKEMLDKGELQVSEEERQAQYDM
jgi:ribosome maturation protein SDO1